MFRNYFKTSFRYIFKNKTYSFISIIGLAFGICCAIFISLYVVDELSYDKFHEKKERIYRISETIDNNGVIEAALTSLPVGPTFKKDYPEVEDFVRFMHMGDNITVRVGDNYFRETFFWFTDSSLFNVMSYKLLQGNKNDVLKDPKSIVLSKSTAEKYFDNYMDAVGETIKLGNSDYTVTGVMEDYNGNTEINYTAFTSISSMPQQQQEVFNQDWFRLCCYTFLLFKEPIAENGFKAEMEDFTERYITPFVESFGAKSSASFSLQNITQLHFDNSKEYDLPKGNESYLTIFIVLALFILTIACINYINLSLSQSIKRAKEVGVRKTLGATPNKIRNQFLGESLIISFIALLVGLMLVEVLMVPFNNITDKSFTFSDVFQLEMVLTMIGITIIAGFVSGFYPAMVLAKLNPVFILRGSILKLGNIGNLRRALMVLQFAFSLFMIIGTISIYMQMDYMQTKDLGFDKDQVVVLKLPLDSSVYNHTASLKEELLKTAFVEEVSVSNSMPDQNQGEIMFRVEQDGQMVDLGVKMMMVDERFIPILGLDLLRGRNFSEEIKTDIQQGFIVNETAAKRFGWNEEAIDKRVQWGLGPNGTAQFDGKVVGVVKDFNFVSLHNPLEPLILIFRPSQSLKIAAKLDGNNIDEALGNLEATWVKFAGNHPFEYEFMDDRIDRFYMSESVLMKIFGYFSIISIIIAAMGLFSLTSFMIEQRMKELSVRKILGAGTLDFSKLLGKDFVILWGVALVIISPLAYYAISIWLQDFSYRINVPVFSFLLAALVTLLITLLTIGYHIKNLVKANPARNLRID